MATPWAQIRQDADQQALLSPTAMPDNSAAPVFPSPKPNVTPAKPTPGEQQIGNDQQQLEKVRWQQNNPWGTPENHPGHLGKIAHAFSVLGNIAGDVVAPNVMARVPGTQAYGKEQEGELANRLNQEITNEGQNKERAAMTAQTEEETREAPQKAASTQALQGAQTGNLASETTERDANAAMGPNLASGYAHAVNEAIKAGRDPSTDPIVQHLSDAIQEIQKPVTPKSLEHVGLQGDKGPMMGNFHPDTGRYTDTAGNVIANPRPIPPPPSYGQLILPTKTTTYLDPESGLPTEYQWNAKTQKYDLPVGASSTGGYGHEAAQAGAVQRAGGQLVKDIDANRADLGTLGAWVGKYGLNTPIADPKLARLQAEMASFAALNPAMHGARGLHAMEHFEKLVGGLQQNPDASIEGIRGIIQTAHEINPTMGGSQQQQGPKAGEVVDGFRFKGGNPADKNSWERVAQ